MCNELEYQGVTYTREQFRELVRDGSIIIPNNPGLHKITKVDEFRTWDLGALEGQNEKNHEEEIDDKILNHPNESMAGGESFNQFQHRALTKFRELLRSEPNNTVIITHSSLLKLFNVWDKGNRPTTLKVDRRAYVKAETFTGDAVPFKSVHGTLWIVRHGQTEDNVLGNLRSRDTKLTQKGLLQAQEVGEKMADIQIPHVYSSPLDRAIKTSNIILDHQLATPTETQTQGKVNNDIDVGSNKPNEVQRELESVRLMSTPKVQQEWTKLKKGSINIMQFLNNSQFPKEQKFLIQSIYENENPETLGDIVSSLAAKYSYTVEVNTAKGNTKYKGSYNEEGYFEQDASGAIEEGAATQHYSHMTVPGGTNYTENEIATPGITPSIKGHAQFSTNNGIGWFRADDKLDNAQVTEREIVDEVDEMGNNYDVPDGIKKFDTKGGTPTKTRRILEVQSDLFQKGRDNDSIVKGDMTGNWKKVIDQNLIIKLNKLYETNIDDIFTGRDSTVELNGQQYHKSNNEWNYLPKSDNQFLQLLNKDGNWIPFFIKSIVQDSAKKGYEKVLFPTGDTASKVEGHETLEQFKRQKESRLKDINRQIDNYTPIYDPNELLDDGPHNSLDDLKREKEQLQEELKRVDTEGFAALKPIYNFYETRIKHTLDKAYGKDNIERIKDEHGNEWWQLQVDPNRDLSIIHYDIHIPQEFRNMPFKFSAHKILAGKKFITVRPQSYQMGTYQEGKNKFNVIPEGKMTLAQYIIRNGGTRESFIKDFIGDEEIKYSHIEQFLYNNKPMNIYSVSKVTSNDDIIPEIADNRYARIYANRLAIIKRLKGQLKAEKDPLAHQELQARLDMVKEEAEVIRSDDTRTFGMLLNMMKTDIATAAKILDTRTDPKSLSFAKSITANYGSLLMDDFEDVYNGMNGAGKLDMQNFMNDATKFAERITKQEFALQQQEIKRLTDKDVLKVDGMPVDAKDINLGAAWSYDTRWNNNPIVQSLTRTIRDAQTTINLRMVEFRETNNKLVKDLKKAGHNFDFMIQTDKNGKRTGRLVDRLSNDYYEEKAKASEHINDKILFYANNHSFKINQDAQDIRDNRTREFFTNTNNIVYKDGDTKSYEQQVKENAQRMVDKKNPYTFKAIIDKALLHPTRITQMERDFFNDYLNYNGFWAEKVRDNWVNPLEMRAYDSWVDPKWQDIQSMPKSDPRRAFYDHMEDHLKQGHKMRRDENGYLPWNYIPEKYKPIGVLSKVQQFWHDHLAQRLSVNKDTINPETGEVEKKIPLYMLNDTLSPENKSYDLGNVLEDFMKETWNYDEKSKVEDSANMMLSMLKSQRVYETNSDGSVKMANGEEQFKKGLSNNYIQAAHRVAATIYGETQDQELVSGTKLFTKDEQDQLKDIKGKLGTLGLTPQEKQEALQYTSIRVDYHGNNDKIKDYVTLATKYQKIYDNANNLTGSKAANSVMFLASVTYLGLNLFAGLGEILQGYSTLFTESAGGRYYSDKEAARAMGYAMTNIIPWSNKNKTHFGDIATFFDTMGDIFHESEGRLKSRLESISFAQYKAANYMTNTCFTLAMLMHDTIEDRKGNKHSLFDSLSFDKGRAQWTKDIDQPLYNEDGKPSDYLLSLLHKSDEILALNRERKTFMDPIKLDSKMIGRIVGQFKKNWMIGMFYYRFGDAHESNITGGLNNEGFYRTFWNNIMVAPKMKDPITGEEVDTPILQTALGMPGRLLKYLLQYSTLGKKLGFGNKEGRSEMVEANLKKFMREFSMAMTLWTAILVLEGMGSSSGGDQGRKYMINQLRRMQRDVAQFMDPAEFGSIIKNPAPLISTLVDYTTLITSNVDAAILGHARDSNGNLRVLKSLENIIPYERQIPALYSKFNRAIVYGIN